MGLKSMRTPLVTIALAIGVLAGTNAVASAAVTPSRDANVVAGGLIESAPAGSVKGAEFVTVPPEGNPAGFGETNLAAFPLDGSRYTLLSTGDATLADTVNSAPNTSTNNFGSDGGHGQVFDVVTLRLDLQVPADENCLTFDFRLLSEEYPEFVGSQYNDGFVAELDQSDFSVVGPGHVEAQRNFAIDENGRVPTVNTTGTSADNAIGTTYDGGTPILRAATPVTPGGHPLFLSVYDASDAIYDTSVLLDNLRLRNVPAVNCTKGAVPTPSEGGQCQGMTPTVIAADGVATGTKGDDVILGSKFADDIRGRGGDDVICGRGGKDTIKGGAGDDTIQGNNGKDTILGRDGNDDLRGNKRSDVLRGNDGDDVLRGQRGGDDLHGGSGTDECHGGKGSDSKHGCES
jgi:Ca2+-binding RTX toxin-like protein